MNIVYITFKITTKKKKKLIITIILPVIALILTILNFSDNNRKTFFTTSSHPPPTSYYNEFIIGAFDLSHDTFYTYTDYFNFNLWHHYPNLSYNQISNNWYTQGWDWHIASPEDLLEADESEYGQTIEDILDDNINAGMNTFF